MSHWAVTLQRALKARVVWLLKCGGRRAVHQLPSCSLPALCNTITADIRAGVLMLILARDLTYAHLPMFTSKTKAVSKSLQIG